MFFQQARLFARERENGGVAEEKEGDSKKMT